MVSLVVVVPSFMVELHVACDVCSLCRVPGIQQSHVHLVVGANEDGGASDAWAELVHDVARVDGHRQEQG